MAGPIRRTVSKVLRLGKERRKGKHDRRSDTERRKEKIKWAGEKHTRQDRRKGPYPTSETAKYNRYSTFGALEEITYRDIGGKMRRKAEKAKEIIWNKEANSKNIRKHDKDYNNPDIERPHEGLTRFISTDRRNYGTDRPGKDDRRFGIVPIKNSHPAAVRLENYRPLPAGTEIAFKQYMKIRKEKRIAFMVDKTGVFLVVWNPKNTKDTKFYEVQNEKSKRQLKSLYELLENQDFLKP